MPGTVLVTGTQITNPSWGLQCNDAETLHFVLNEGGGSKKESHDCVGMCVSVCV